MHHNLPDRDTEYGAQFIYGDEVHTRALDTLRRQLVGKEPWGDCQQICRHLWHPSLPTASPHLFVTSVAVSWTVEHRWVTLCEVKIVISPHPSLVAAMQHGRE